MSDKYGSSDNQWYSSEFQRYEREKAQEVLEKMKALEAEFSKTREIIEEKTSFGGTITHYVKKK